MAGKIFISYRREDEIGYAARLYESLCDIFGAGSLFFSHVNDAGFWLVKEYFGMTVGQTIKSWSVMETIISVVGLAGVLLLSVVF